MRAMGDSQEVEDPAVELARLREENARLRALLGLDDRPADGHSVAWSPTLLPTSVAGPPVDAGSSNEAKLELFRSLFGARSDVYAVRWENPSTGKSGWSPATRGGWSRQRRSRARVPAPVRRGAGVSSPWPGGGRHLPAAARRHLHAARLRLRQGHAGCSTRSPTWTPATPTASRPCSSVPARETAATSGSSSPRRFPRRRLGRWARRCCARRWRLAPSWTCPATTGSSPPRTSCPRPGSGT